MWNPLTLQYVFCFVLMWKSLVKSHFYHISYIISVMDFSILYMVFVCMYVLSMQVQFNIVLFNPLSLHRYCKNVIFQDFLVFTSICEEYMLVKMYFMLKFECFLEPGTMKQITDKFLPDVCLLWKIHVRENVGWSFLEEH